MKVSNMEVTYLGGYGSDVTVVNAARVSFAKAAEEMGDGDSRLISYLARNKHHSPFNHAFLSFRIKAPIFVARQLVKHKFMPWNEVSRRYVDDEPEFYIPEVYRKRADNVKQGSSDETVSFKHVYGDIYWDPTHDISHACLQAYQELLNANVCPEQARMVLPQNTMTEWVWSGTLGAWLDMLVLRLDEHTQKETRDVAKMVAEQVYNMFPISAQEYI